MSSFRTISSNVRAIIEDAITPVTIEPIIKASTIVLLLSVTGTIAPATGRRYT